MKTTSFLDNSQRRSPLKDTQELGGKKSKGKGFGRDLGLALPLTSLIDAFSIIVIYLLIGTQGSGIEADIPVHMKLPIANHSQSVEKEHPTLRIQKGRYFLNDKVVSASQLTNRLSELKEKSADKNIELMIQADTEMKYAELDPLIKAGSLAGIEKLKFAVVPQ